MFLTFFSSLRQAGLPVSLKGYLTLIEALDAGLGDYDAETFYHLSRAALVKDEKHIDRFDRVFAQVFRGLTVSPQELLAEIPEEWLRRLTEKFLSEEEKSLIKALGGLDKIMDELKKRLAEQKGRHQGGNKWIGTGGTSPFGAYGYNPEGVRIGQEGNRHNRAVKVWDKREFRDLDDGVELGTRSIKIALRRLRKFARDGAADQLDLGGTIRATAERGWLDVKMVPERRNAVKVLLFLDVGGSMDPHVRICEELFSAARSELKHLDFYYFHNCPYESVWQNNRRRAAERVDTWSLLHKYTPDYKVVFVGDAAMSPYELTQAGGSVEHWNEEPGLAWLGRIASTFPKTVWLNPVTEAHWRYSHSTTIISESLGNRMFPLTLEGLDAAMQALLR